MDSDYKWRDGSMYRCNRHLAYWEVSAISFDSAAAAAASPGASPFQAGRGQQRQAPDGGAGMPCPGGGAGDLTMAVAAAMGLPPGGAAAPWSCPPAAAALPGGAIETAGDLQHSWLGQQLAAAVAGGVLPAWVLSPQALADPSLLAALASGDPMAIGRRQQGGVEEEAGKPVTWGVEGEAAELLEDGPPEGGRGAQGGDEKRRRTTAESPLGVDGGVDGRSVEVEEQRRQVEKERQGRERLTLGARPMCDAPPPAGGSGLSRAKRGSGAVARQLALARRMRRRGQLYLEAALRSRRPAGGSDDDAAPYASAIGGERDEGGRGGISAMEQALLAAVQQASFIPVLFSSHSSTLP